MLKIFLPPNLPAAAARDAIPVKLELDLSARPRDDLLPALALLQSWCGSAKPASPLFLQLTTARVRQLVAHLKGQPVFFWINQPAAPILWIGPILRDVSEHIAVAQTAKSAPPSPPVAPIQNQIPIKATSSSPFKNPVTPLLVDGSEHYLAISLPSRESVSYPAILELLKTSGFTLEPANRKWWLRDRHKVLNFLAAHLSDLRDAWHAGFTPNFEKNTACIAFAEITCETAKDPDGGFLLTLGLQAGSVSENQIHGASSAGRAYVEDVSAKRIFLVAPAQLSRLAAAQNALAGDNTRGGLAARRTHRISAAAIADAQTIIEEIAPHFQPPAEWRARGEALRNLSKLAPAPIPQKLDAQLRPYQRLGAAWFWHLFQNNLGGVLADEMGLGKTIQALSLLAAARSDSSSEFRVQGSELAQSNTISGAAAPTPNSERRTPNSASAPALVVCPASLVENWRREAARFAPQLGVFVHHSGNRLARASDAAAHTLIITSYGTLARDRDLFSGIDFAILIADEAQHLKNRRTQNARALRSLRARSRFLLTGTPLENSLDDLRSLFEILMPGYLAPVPPGARGDERAWHDERLRARTAPYILRRTKAAVAPELPEKIEQIVWCEFGPAQAAFYRDMQENTERALLDMQAGGANENAMRLATLTQLLRLRQICCDPRLAGRAKPPAEPRLENAPLAAAQPEASPYPDTAYPDSAKLDAFRELLAEAIDDGHRILVFSQFTKLLALIREELDAQQIACAYLDGSMPVRARQAEVDRFNNTPPGEPGIPVFLISLKAGGTGLNLTAADTVIHLDPWWNPAVEAQATDRAHRIGQKRVVTSYKLICAGTVEEKVLQLQDSKRALLADVFEASDATTGKLTLADLKALLEQ